MIIDLFTLTLPIVRQRNITLIASTGLSDGLFELYFSLILHLFHALAGKRHAQGWLPLSLLTLWIKNVFTLRAFGLR